MSTLYLGVDPRALADTLADELDASAKHGDFFVPTTVVVPNRGMRKWLRLHLARRLDIAINLRFAYLEDALWQLLHQADPRNPAEQPTPIDENLYRLMVLTVLLDKKDRDLAPLHRYLQLEDGGLNRLSCRRAWSLAHRLGLLLRDYEYDRQDELIQPWLTNELGLKSASEFHRMMERAQRALFRHITREPDGQRALLNRDAGPTFMTFPQYTMELLVGQTARPKKIAGPPIHFFGFTNIADLHLRAIAWLGQTSDVRFYHVNAVTTPSEEPNAFAAWGRAGVESRGLVERRLGAFKPRGEVLRTPGIGTVLTHLHDHLLHRVTNPARIAQDRSLQIVGCAGPLREAETVYNSILHNLHEDRALRQTDVGVLVTDMAKYRPILQAVFERPPCRLMYNLVDYRAAATSTFGQALLGMLDLALDSFSRARVFQVVLNPCFLARLGVDRSAASVWLDWADSLGVYQGWDAEEKEEQGYPRSPFYAWRLGLQRLRLGRYMDVAAEDDTQPAPRFGHVLPFADVESGEREQLDAFCQAIEGLLPSLARLRRTPMTGERWATTLRRLMQDFLDVPADRPEEAQVQEQLLASLAPLAHWDAMGQRGRGLPLPLVREYVHSQLESLPGQHGDYLTGGVTIAELQPMRPVPFSIIYVLGLGDDLFPGSNALSSFDLRGAARIPGDVRPAEQRQYDFLATILAAQKKLYLLYSNHDLQKDQTLLPAVPLQQLQRYLGRHVLTREFEPVTMPIALDDERYVDPAQQPATQDVLVHYREAERTLALRSAERGNRLAFDLMQQAELAERGKGVPDFTLLREGEAPAEPALSASSSNNPASPGATARQEPRPPATKPRVVSLSELRRFLQLPALAALRRHLHIEEDDDDTGDEDDEPLVTGQRVANALTRQTIQQLILSAAKSGVEPALEAWQERFTSAYTDARLRCQVPEEAFGEIDQAALRRDLVERIHGPGQIEAFLRDHAAMTFCGPVLIGESQTPLGARLRFPALCFNDAAGPIRVVGSVPYAWQKKDRFEILIVTNSKAIDAREISSALFEPMLFYLTLLAGATPDWMEREVVLNVAHQGGIARWPLPPGTIAPAEATTYLAELTRDFLDPTQFDLLPFDLISGGFEIKRAIDSTFTGHLNPEAYVGMLRSKIAEARENTFGRPKIPPLVAMIGAQAPDDALAKVQRRFLLLDRAAALVRRAPRVRKPAPRPAKAKGVKT